MSKHTPGPWMVDQPWGDIRAEVGTLIAYDEGTLGGGNEECQANARLIAAAPELRESIEAALKEWDILPRDRAFTLAEVTDWLTRYMAPAMDAMRAAIAKAEGKG